MEFVLGNLGVVIKDFFRKTAFMDMEKCIGQMVMYTKDGGVITFRMEKDNYMYKAKD